MSNIATIALSLAVIFAFVLAAGGVYILLKRPRSERIKGLLMVAVSVVTIGNVWLLSAPID
ncbi:MAG: hypothetical protein WA979_00515 [Pacificimonas sp.]